MWSRLDCLELSQILRKYSCQSSKLQLQPDFLWQKIQVIKHICCIALHLKLNVLQFFQIFYNIVHKISAIHFIVWILPGSSFEAIIVDCLFIFMIFRKFNTTRMKSGDLIVCGKFSTSFWLKYQLPFNTVKNRLLNFSVKLY